jgi:hypothetical protein
LLDGSSPLVTAVKFIVSKTPGLWEFLDRKYRARRSVGSHHLGISGIHCLEADMHCRKTSKYANRYFDRTATPVGLFSAARGTNDSTNP